MAPSAIQKGDLKFISNLTSEEFPKHSKLIEKTDRVKVKQAQKGGNVYLKIVWMKEANKKPIDAKIAYKIIDGVIMEFENLPQDRLGKRITLDDRPSSVTQAHRATREGWVSFPVKGELQQARAAASCFQQMLKRKVGTAVEVKGTNLNGELEVLFPVASDVAKK